MKIIIDILMTAALLLLMAYSLVGEAAHEWIGAGIFLLFVIHHVLNIKWHKNLIRGKYTPSRVFRTSITMLALLAMAGSMVSGVLLSRHVFRLDVRALSPITQTVHMLSAYWGFVFLSLHLGLHWNAMMGMARRLVKGPSALRKLALRSGAALLAAYGLYAFVKRDLGNYMLLRYHFVFFDFEEPLALFLLDYAAVMGLFVCLGHYFSAFFQLCQTRRKSRLRPQT